ncbi:immunoglobulin G-binding protein H-like [Cyprinodon tularosa]|uniref:immunoglobulin G-binding protein H-like n=1 Tax=Cyprinodon tularosa TaxID=77115 RepID=UPI0018E22570|nr:immunoglobulin G-binding protein H-like [Cyprinodon tularosa]
MPSREKYIELKELRELNRRNVQHLCGLYEQLERDLPEIDFTCDANSWIKAEMKFSKQLEKRAHGLQQELKAQEAFRMKQHQEDEKVEALRQRNAELKQQAKTAEEQLVDTTVMKLQFKIAKAQEEKLKKNNKILMEKVESLTKELSFQTKLDKSYRETQELLGELEKTEASFLQKIQEKKQNLEPGMSTWFAYLGKTKQHKIEKQITSIMKKMKDMKKYLDHIEPYFRKDPTLMNNFLSIASETSEETDSQDSQDSESEIEQVSELSKLQCESSTDPELRTISEADLEDQSVEMLKGKLSSSEVLRYYSIIFNDR